MQRDLELSKQYYLQSQQVKANIDISLLSTPMGILSLVQGLFNGTAFITTPGMLGCIQSG
jgi:hypothetical protein